MLANLGRGWRIPVLCHFQLQLFYRFKLTPAFNRFCFVKVTLLWRGEQQQSTHVPREPGFGSSAVSSGAFWHCFGKLFCVSKQAMNKLVWETVAI